MVLTLRDYCRDLAALFGLSVAAMAVGAVLGASAVLAGWTGGATGSRSTPGVPVELDALSLLETNLIVLAGLLSGGLLFGVPTILSLFQNGFVLGVLAGTALQKGELAQYLLLLVPHGIVELPAFWLAGGLGLKLPRDAIMFVRGARDSPITGDDVSEYVYLTFVSVSLLVLAALVESTLTATLATGGY